MRREGSSAVYERDYILRLITQVGHALRAMVHAIREQRPDDALETARDAILALTDADPVLVDAMTGEGLVTFLSAGGRIDVLRCRMLAEVLVERAEAYQSAGQDARAAAERERARVLLEAAAREADGEDAESIAALVERIDAGEGGGGSER